MASLPAPKTAGFSYADYLGWKDGGQYELIDGVVYDMSPAPSPSHQRLVVELLTLIRNFLSDRDCEVFVAPFDVRLPRPDLAEDHQIVDVVQPDILVVCDPKKIDDRGCLGAPDWIIEILSPSTAAKDHIEKFALYERGGVREYWMVSPDYRIVNAYRLGPDGRFGRGMTYSEGKAAPSEVLPGLTVDLETLFFRI